MPREIIEVTVDESYEPYKNFWSFLNRWKTKKNTPPTIETKTENETIGIGVYCLCGGIIYACTYESYRSDKESREEFESFVNRNYKVGRVSKKQVQEKFGCSCPKRGSIFLYKAVLIYNILFRGIYKIYSTPEEKSLFYVRPLFYAIKRKKKIYYNGFNKYPKNCQYITTYRRLSWW